MWFFHLSNQTDVHQNTSCCGTPITIRSRTSIFIFNSERIEPREASTVYEDLQVPILLLQHTHLIWKSLIVETAVPESLHCPWWKSWSKEKEGSGCRSTCKRPENLQRPRRYALNTCRQKWIPSFQFANRKEYQNEHCFATSCWWLHALFYSVDKPTSPV